MSLKKNVIANYVGQGYSVGIGFIVTPFFLQYLGPESYGLVGFFALMQAWMSILDAGISPTLGRETAVMRGQPGNAVVFWELLKSFEAIFFVLGLLAAFGIFIGSDWFAENWINLKDLNVHTAKICIQIMGALVALRWLAALYRSGINGFEDQVWLNGYNIIIITVKFGGALALVAYISNSIIHFFAYQLGIGILELVVLALRFYSHLFRPDNASYFSFNLSAVKTVAPFALGVAYTSGVWTLLTQTDKLLLSSILSLEEFGYLSLISLASNGVILASNPISQSLKPRLTYLFSKGGHKELILLYRNMMQLSAVIAISICALFITIGDKILIAWTGNRVLAEWGYLPLVFFSVGNAFLAMSSYSYYLQAACGTLSLHIKYSTAIAIIQVPLIFYAAVNYGVLGVGIAWSLFVGFSFVLWTPYVHKFLFPGIRISMLRQDIFPVAIPIILAALILVALGVEFDESRIALLIYAAVILFTFLFFGLLGSRLFRQWLKSFLGKISWKFYD